MSVPLDLSLINQLLTEQQTQGDLNNLTKPGFFFVLWPTNTPNDRKNSCHVINLVNYISNEHTAENMRIFQIYINDNRNDNTIWFRQYSEVWTAWERFVTATDLADYVTKNLLATTLENYYAKGVIDEKLGSKVNNSDLVADYYNKTDVDALINTINTRLGTKATAIGYHNITISAKIYDTTGTAHSETSEPSHIVFVGKQSDGLIGKVQETFALKDDYPVNTKLTKIAFSREAFEILRPLVPATITIKFPDDTLIVATLDTDNSDTEYFIYNVPTNLQNKTISTGTEFTVYYVQ